MIGRLQHLSDASKAVYVVLAYSAETGDWRPLPDGVHTTKLAAYTACTNELRERAIELNTRSDELQINLGRLLAPPSREDIIHIGGVLHVLDARTGYLVPAGSPASGSEAEPRSEGVTEEVMESLSRAQECTHLLLCADKLEHSAGLLRDLAEAWRRAAPGRLPPGDAGETA